jgi:hypothetical protein
MILEPLVGLSLIVTVSVESGVQPAPHNSPNGISAQQKSVVMRPLVRSATECVLRAVAADPRMRSSLEAADIRDLIVASIPSCADAMRAMIDAHDQLYGQGSGETFFMGPYLDMLPSTVIKSVKDTAR